MRSGSTSSPPSTSAMLAAAPPAAAGLRRWRPTRPARRRRRARAPAPAPPSSAGDQAWARRAQASASDGADGVALVRHRRRAAAPLAALGDLADLGLREQHDVERDLAERPGARSRARAPSARDAHARVCHGQRRLGQPELGARARRPRGPVSPSAASVPDRPAELHGQPAARASTSRARRRALPTSQPRPCSPNVVGSACWSSVRATIGVSRCASREPGAGVGDARRRRSSSGSSARRADEHRGGVDDVLARRAVVHVRRGLAADARAQRATSGLGRIPAAPASTAIALGSKQLGSQTAAIASASGGIRPRTAGPATASARSTSSIAWSQARSVSSARTRSGTKRASNTTPSDLLEPDVVLGERSPRRVEVVDVAQLRELQLRGRTRRRRRAVQHRRHPPREVLGTPDAPQARRGVGVEAVAVAAAYQAIERLGAGRCTSAIARLSPLAPVGGHDVGGVAGEEQPAVAASARRRSSACPSRPSRGPGPRASVQPSSRESRVCSSAQMRSSGHSRDVLVGPALDVEPAAARASAG